MQRSRHIKLVVTGRQRADDKTNEAVWPDRILWSFKSWLTTPFGRKPVLVIRDDENEPLLEERKVFVPRHAAVSFLRTATPRAMMRHNEAL